MNVVEQEATDFLPLTPAVFHILLAVADLDRHGLGIMHDVEERTDGAVVLGPGTLYGAIKRLLRREWIEEVTASFEDLDDERLRYYAATPDGLAAAREEATRMAALLGIAQAKSLIA